GRRGRPGESRGTDPVPQGLRHEDQATGTQDPNRLPAEPQEIGKMPDDTKTPDLVDRAIGEWQSSHVGGNDANASDTCSVAGEGEQSGKGIPPDELAPGP